jgi:hypothetical protein
MKTPHELQEMANQIIAKQKEEESRNLLAEIERIEGYIANSIASGRESLYFTSGFISNEVIALLINNGYTVQKGYNGYMPHDFYYSIYLGSDPKYIDTYEEERMKELEKRKEQKKSFWQKLFS